MERYSEDGRPMVRVSPQEAAAMAAEGLTDWERLRVMTDEEIEAAARTDQDAPPLSDEDMAGGRFIRLDLPDAPGLPFAERVRQASLRRTKTLISMRCDQDVLEWYKDQGRGYQTLMNDVLRAYMESRRRD